MLTPHSPSPAIVYKVNGSYANAIEFLIHLCLCGLMISIPISKGGASTFMGILVGLSIIKLFISNISIKELITSHSSTAIFSLIYIPYLISILYSDNQSEAWKFIYKHNHFVFIPLIVLVNRVHFSTYFERYVSLLIVSTCFAGLLTIFLYLLPEQKTIELVEANSYLGLKPYEKLSKREAFGVYSPFLVRLQFGNIIALSSLACCWLITRKSYRYLGIFSLITLISTALILGSRGSQLGMVAGLGIWLAGVLLIFIYPILKRRIGKRIAIILSISSFLLLIGIFPILAYQYVPAIKQRYGQLMWELSLFSKDQYDQYDYIYFTSLRRIVAWNNGWELIKQSPIWGTGVGDYKQELRKIYESDEWIFPVNNHNAFIFFWGSCGIIGILTFLGLLIYWTYDVIKNGDKWVIIWGVSTIFCYLIIFTLDVGIFSQVDRMTFVLMMAFPAIKSSDL